MKSCVPQNGNPAFDFIFRFNTRSISGNVFTDYDCDGTKDSGDTNYAGAQLALSGGSTSSATTDSSGNYTFSNLTSNQNYSVTAAAPAGHRVTTTNPMTYNSLSSNITNANFGLCPIAQPWFQTKDADLLTPGVITSKIPTQCVVSTSCQEYLSLPGDGGYEGVAVYATGTPNFGHGTVSSRGWIANTRYTGQPYSYSYFANRMPSTATKINDAQVGGDFINTAASSSGYGWLFRDGNLEITSASNLGDKRAVLFVNGNLTIKNRITVNKGKGFFAAFVSGDISIDPTVADPNQPALEGIFFANRNIGTGTKSTTTPVADDRLYVRGALVALGNILLQRDLDPARSGTGNNITPAEFIEYAPDLILNFPPELLRDGVSWEEVAP